MKGVAMLSFEFIDPKKDTIIYSYVPAIRRVRQLTGTARSDKVFGTDGCLDFYMMFAGKIAVFDWKFLGEREVVANFIKTDKDIGTIDADGAFHPVMYLNKFGHETPGWKGVAWAPTESVWVPRPVWVIQGENRDPYYNFGKQIFYIDKELFLIWQREDYDRSGAFWQWNTYCTHLTETQDGSLNTLTWDYSIIIDEKIKHASISNYTPKSGGSRYYVPSETLGASFYSVQTMRRLSK